jgi:hypothetical protein
MKALLLGFVLGSAAPALADTVAFENIAFRMPAGWTQAEQNQDIFLKPGDLAAGQSFVVAIAHEGDKADGTLAEGLEQSWREFAGAGSTVSDRTPAVEIKTTTGATGLSSSGVLGTRGARVVITVVVFKPMGHYRVVAALANSEAARDKYHDAFVGLVESLDFTARKVVAPSVASADQSATYELLLTFASGLSASPTGGSDYGAGTYVYCVFADGSWLETAPNRGLNGYDLAAEHQKRATDFGSWQRSNAVLTLRATNRVETLFPQPDGSYLRKDAQARAGTYFRVPTSTGLRFAGRYIKDGQSDGASTVSITFRADGTFEDHGVVHMILPDEIGVRYRDISEVLGPGAGTYEIANNTVTLSYGDGRRKPMLFILTPKLATQKTPDAIYLGKVWFRKT